jgi:hypothetical protein
MSSLQLHSFKQPRVEHLWSGLEDMKCLFSRRTGYVFVVARFANHAAPPVAQYGIEISASRLNRYKGELGDAGLESGEGLLGYWATGAVASLSSGRAGRRSGRARHGGRDGACRRGGRSGRHIGAPSTVAMGQFGAHCLDGRKDGIEVKRKHFVFLGEFGDFGRCNCCSGHKPDNNWKFAGKWSKRRKMLGWTVLCNNQSRYIHSKTLSLGVKVAARCVV